MGLRVAIDVAMIPIPGSTVLQIAKFVVASKQNVSLCTLKESGHLT